MQVEMLAPGFWRWTAQLDGDDSAGLYIESGPAVVLVDPAVPPEARTRFLDALDRDVARLGVPVEVALTGPAVGERAAELVERYGATLWEPGEARAPAGLVPVATDDPRQALFWIPAHRTLYAGDSLRSDGHRLRLAAGLVTARSLLLELPVERVICRRGAPLTGAAAEALREALSGG